MVSAGKRVTDRKRRKMSYRWQSVGKQVADRKREKTCKGWYAWENMKPVVSGEHYNEGQNSWDN